MENKWREIHKINPDYFSLFFNSDVITETFQKINQKSQKIRTTVHEKYWKAAGQVDEVGPWTPGREIWEN